VVAYETNEACAEFRQTGEILRDNAIVGSFTLANTTAGFAFGNDAFGLGVQGGQVVLPPPDGRDVDRFDIQIFNPNTVDVSSVFLVRLEEQPGRPVIPDAGPPAAPARFATHFIDNFEVPTSLPDTTVGCVEVTDVQPGLIPPSISIDSSGIIRLVPVSGLEDSDYIYGVVGEAIGSFGAASSVKAVYSEGSASEAFLNTVTSLAD
jgi:hypothetical protein